MNIIIKFNGKVIKKKETPLGVIIQNGINIMRRIYKEQMEMTEL